MLTADIIVKIRDEFESGSSTKQLSEKYEIGTNCIRRILRGESHKGIGRSDKFNRYRENAKDDNEVIIRMYNDNVPVLDICTKFNINLPQLNAIRNKYKIKKRGVHNAVSKSVTLLIDDQIITFPTITSASEYTKIPEDYIRNLMYGETYLLGKHSQSDIKVIHDINRIRGLEDCCRLMVDIILHRHGASSTDKGSELSNMLTELGFLEKDELNYLKHENSKS